MASIESERDIESEIDLAWATLAEDIPEWMGGNKEQEEADAWDYRRTKDFDEAAAWDYYETDVLAPSSFEYEPESSCQENPEKDDSSDEPENASSKETDSGDDRTESTPLEDFAAPRTRRSRRWDNRKTDKRVRWSRKEEDYLHSFMRRYHGGELRDLRREGEILREGRHSGLIMSVLVGTRF